MHLALKTIVAATDFSPPSQLALAYARTMAATFGASLHLVHVVEDPFPMTDFYLPEATDLRRRLISEAQNELGKCVRDIGSGIAVTIEVLIGSPAKRIVEAAAIHDADLIVVGTHGRGALAHLLMGSVAERVGRTAECPVLTVRDVSLVAEVGARTRGGCMPHLIDRLCDVETSRASRRCHHGDSR
jgi:nucleotide-binding universal stress UspA family protein